MSQQTTSQATCFSSLIELWPNGNISKSFGGPSLHQLVHKHSCSYLGRVVGIPSNSSLAYKFTFVFTPLGPRFSFPREPITLDFKIHTS